MVLEPLLHQEFEDLQDRLPAVVGANLIPKIGAGGGTSAMCAYFVSVYRLLVADFFTQLLPGGGRQRSQASKPANVPNLRGNQAAARARATSGDTLNHSSLWEIPEEDRQDGSPLACWSQWNDLILGQTSNDDATATCLQGC